MDKKSYDVRVHQWAQLIENANQSKLQRKDWLEQNGIAESTFYYWQRKLRLIALENEALCRPAITEPEITEVTGSDDEHELYEVDMTCLTSSHNTQDRSLVISSPQDSKPHRSLSIWHGDFRIDISSDTDKATLRKTLEVIRDV